MLTHDDYIDAAINVFRLQCFSHTDCESAANELVDLVSTTGSEYRERFVAEFYHACGCLSRSMDIRGNGLELFIHHLHNEYPDKGDEAHLLYKLVAGSCGAGIGLYDEFSDLTLQYWRKKLSYAEPEAWNDELFCELITAIADDNAIELELDKGS